MQDQLVIFMALAKGRSSVLCAELTMHTRTAISIAEQLLPGVQFSISSLPAVGKGRSSQEGAKGPQEAQLLYMVQCTGVGAVVDSSRASVTVGNAHS